MLTLISFFIDLAEKIPAVVSAIKASTELTAEQKTAKLNELEARLELTMAKVKAERFNEDI